MAGVRNDYSDIEDAWVKIMLGKLPSTVHTDLGMHILRHRTYETGIKSNEEYSKIKFESKCGRDGNTMYSIGVWKIPKMGDFIHRDMQGVVNAVKKFDDAGDVVSTRVDFYCIAGHTTVADFGCTSIEHGMLMMSKELDDKPLGLYDLQMVNPIVVKVLFCILQIIESEKKIKNEKNTRINKGG